MTAARESAASQFRAWALLLSVPGLSFALAARGAPVPAAEPAATSGASGAAVAPENAGSATLPAPAHRGGAERDTKARSRAPRKTAPVAPTNAERVRSVLGAESRGHGIRPAAGRAPAGRAPAGRAADRGAPAAPAAPVAVAAGAPASIARPMTRPALITPAGPVAQAGPVTQVRTLTRPASPPARIGGMLPTRNSRNAIVDGGAVRRKF